MEQNCDKCKRKLSISLFHKNVTGYRSTCKECRYKRTKELREARKIHNINKLSYKKNKICDKCNKNKPITEFNRRNVSKDGLCSQCRDCYNSNRKKSIPEQKTNSIVSQTKKCNTCLIEKSLSEFKQTKKSNDGHYHKCKSCWKPVEWNKEKQKASEKKYVQNNPEKIRLKWKRDSTKINRRIRDSLNKRIKEAFYSQKQNKSNKTFDYVGCSKNDLKRWFEYLFTENMSWDNYGKWHIDHVIPCASFDLSSDNEIKKCFNWKNLRPCWGEENIEKSSKIIAELIQKQEINVNNFLNIPLPNHHGDRDGGTE